MNSTGEIAVRAGPIMPVGLGRSDNPAMSDDLSLADLVIDPGDPCGTVHGIDRQIWARLRLNDQKAVQDLWRIRRMVAQQLGVTPTQMRAYVEQLTEVADDPGDGPTSTPSPSNPGQPDAEASPDLTSDISPEPTSASPSAVAAPALILHPHQCPPAGDWATWLVLAGRGAGKTLAGASWVADRAADLGKGGRIALIGATLHDVREVMIEGPSGLMSLPRWQATGRWEGPRFQPSRRRLSFPGGCEGQMFSAEDPDSLRGPQFHAAWADEFCAWARTDPEAGALAMVRLGLRLASKPGPQLMVTTTPRPTRALKGLMAEPGCEVSRAATGANAAHLSEGFVAGLRRLYGGTRLEAQEIEGQVVDDGLALWTAPMLAACRGVGPERFDTVVVGVDPSVTAGGHACGIVVVGRAGDRAYVLADRTMGGVSPDTWAKAAVQAAADYEAQAVVAEVNQGGELVTGLLRAVGGGVAVRAVRASVGKRARAEPVAALYEQGRVAHIGAGLDRLEEALMDFDGEGDGQDRADALVWAVTELMLGPPPLWPRIRVW